MEALRLEQSEFILREATSDIKFDGYFIPKRTRIRIAVWESHKDTDHFADPFRFDPQRFVGRMPPADSYAPFGLDKHRCLGADWVVKLSAAFVERLAAGLRWEVMGSAVAERGVFHFEPSRTLSIRVRRVGEGGV
jgi:cytochrome P450